MSIMKSERRPDEGADPEREGPPREVIDRLAGLLPEGVLDEAVRGLRPEELSGPGGLLSQLAGRVVEAALEAELTDPLGPPPGGRPQGAVYTTNTIEGLHRQVRKAIKTRGHFPDEQAATKLIYLALIKADAKW